MSPMEIGQAGAWRIVGWRRVCASPTIWPEVVRRLRARSVAVSDEANPAGLRQGNVLWSVDEPVEGTVKGPLGLAWEWTEVQPEVLALTDPMAVLSNADLTDDSGQQLASEVRILQLNHAIHTLNWQPEVLALLPRCAMSS